MSNRELHSISTRLASELRQSGGPVECGGNRFVEHEFESYWEHNHYFVEWRISPKDQRNSVWLAQASIASEGSDEVGSFIACQAGLTSAVVPEMQLFLLGTDRNIRPGMMLRLGVTGYVKVGEDPHVQFCFEVQQPAE